MLRSVLAVTAGVAVAVVIFSLVQLTNGILFAPPSPIDYNDKDALATLVASMPKTAFAILAAGYVFGSFLAGLLAGKLLKSRSPAAWTAVGLIDIIFIGMVLIRLLAAASLFNLLPDIVKMLLPFLILGGALVGGIVLSRIAASAQPRPVGLAEPITIGILLTAGWASNVMSIPHPLWMAVVGFFFFIPAVLIGAWIASDRKALAG